jgi:hypothetical protein
MVQLQNHPLCALCLERNIIKAARVVHHLEPHGGDWELFRLGELQSLCKEHHDGIAQSEERRGFNKGCNVDGSPIADRWQRKQPFSIPHGIKESAIPVHIVCGAPGSGKTTFVRKHAKPGDWIIDFDDIREAIGASRYSDNPRDIKGALSHRDQMLRALSLGTRGTEAWLVVMAPTRAERDAWCTALGKDKASIHVIPTGTYECKRRIEMDNTREGHRARLFVEVDRWFAKYNKDNKHGEYL